MYNEARALRVDAEDEAAGFGANDDVALRIDGDGAGMRFVGGEPDRTLARGRHAVDFAFVASGDVEVVGTVEREGPDVLRFGIVERIGFAGGVDAVDLAVGRGGGVDAVLRVDGDGVDLEPVEFGEHFALAGRVGDKELGFVRSGGTAAGVDVALGVLSHGPEEGGSCVVHFAKHGSERETPVAAQGDILESRLFEIARVVLLPELGFHRVG